MTDTAVAEAGIPKARDFAAFNGAVAMTVD